MKTLAFCFRVDVFNHVIFPTKLSQTQIQTYRLLLRFKIPPAVTRMDTLNQVGHIMFITQHICFPLFSVLSYDSYHVFWVKMTTLFGVFILVTTYPQYSKQTLLCNKHNVPNLIPPVRCGLGLTVNKRNMKSW